MEVLMGSWGFMVLCFLVHVGEHENLRKCGEGVVYVKC